MGFVKVGQRIKYLSPCGVKSRSDNWKPNVWLEDGIIGTVTEYQPALPRRVVGGEVFERIPPYAVVRFDNGARTCIDGDKDGRQRWERVS